MAITSIKTGSSFTNLQKYNDFLGPNAAYDPAATWLIQRTTLGTAATTITLSSIPSTYQHLQLRCLLKGTTTATATGVDIYMQINSDTGNNYAWHRLNSDGASATASGTASTSNIIPIRVPNNRSTLANIWGTAIIDIHDYASTTKAKTVRVFSGSDDNNIASGNVSNIRLSSGLWTSTSAITSITFGETNSNNILAGSTIALYGMKG